MHPGTQLVWTFDVHVRIRRMLQLLTIGENTLAGQLGRHVKALQCLQECTHVPEGLDRSGINRIRCWLSSGGWRSLRKVLGAATDIASRLSTRSFVAWLSPG